jgi:hypothetical protein
MVRRKTTGRDAPPDVSFTTRGGARVGFLNIGWPLARLDVTRERLTLTSTLFWFFEIGKCTFTREQIKSIEQCDFGFSLFGTGIRIVHTVEDYPRKIIFSCRANTVLAGIAATGFAPGKVGR